MDQQKLIDLSLEKMKAAGFERVQLELDESEKHELNQQHGEINLLRTGFNNTLYLTGIHDARRASLSVNNLSEQSIQQAVQDLLDMAKGSPQDDAYDIAPAQPAESFDFGASAPDADLMYERLDDFINYSKSHHPSTILEEAVIDFTHNQSRLVNSNGVDFNVGQGLYNASVMFTSKDGVDTSSFNYAGFSSLQLEKKLQDEAYLAELLTQSEEQVRTRSIPSKFNGDLLIMPHVLEEFTGFLMSNISDMSMISGTSIYQDSLDAQVASALLSIHCKPRHGGLASSYPLTSDGNLARDMTLVDRGNLKSYLLGIYGSNKTGKAIASNDGNGLIVDAGETSLDDMISGIEKGVLLGRFSGGSPNDKGDFSGIAKNSYYIENGKIQYPISETMVSGNIANLLKDVNTVSKEQINFGSSILPWICSTGLVFS